MSREKAAAWPPPREEEDEAATERPRKLRRRAAAIFPRPLPPAVGEAAEVHLPVPGAAMVVGRAEGVIAAASVAREKQLPEDKEQEEEKQEVARDCDNAANKAGSPKKRKKVRAAAL